MSSYYDKEELLLLGFQSVGENVLISRKASIYGAANMSVGNHVRIDDFCFLSGKIILKNYIHIATSCIMHGSTEGIIMEDFSGISSRVVIHGDSDDYSGESLTNPMTPENLKHITKGLVHLKKHVIIGSNSVILPGVIVEEGCAVGAMSLIKDSTLPWGLYAGIPCKRIKDRKKDLLKLEEELIQKAV